MKLIFKLQMYYEHPNARRTEIYNIPHILNPGNIGGEFKGYFAWLNSNAANVYVNSHLKTWIKYQIKKL